MSLSLLCRKVVLCAGLAAGIPGSLLGQNFYVANGGQYAVAGVIPGDQVHPHVALKSSGGYLVWEDAFTDGNGLGISALRLDSSLSGTLSPFRVNQNATNNQERARVSLLKAGGAAFVWQGGKKGFQNIYARFLSTSNTWITGDVLVNTFTNNTRINPAITTLGNSNVVVVWGSLNQQATNSMQDVYGQILSPAGAKVGGEFLVNQYTAYNQRTPVVAALGGGGFVVVWVSELQRQGLVTVAYPNVIYDQFRTNQPSVDIYARLYAANGSPVGSEFLVNTANNTSANPSVAAASDGGFLVAWGEKDLNNVSNSWDIVARPFSSAGVGGTARRVNTFVYGDQFAPQVSSIGTDYFVVWTSLAQDGDREGVFGQFLHGDGSLNGSEIRVNTTTISQQIHPVVASDGAGRFLTVWSSYTVGPSGFDLFAQRFLSSSLAPLTAPDPPYVSVLGSNALSVTWPALAGFSVSNYEVYADGSPTATAIVTNTWWTMGNLAPSSTHFFQLAYVLNDGRKSPPSLPATNTTYSAMSWGGIPYDWMVQYFGTDAFSWPSPYADSDGDGVSNLNEFLAGTNPMNSNSVLRVNLQVTKQGLYLDWPTQPGLIYQVQTSVNMGPWVNVGAARCAAGSVDSMYVSIGNNAYFRVLRVR
jgi:hypothetical protein